MPNGRQEKYKEREKQIFPLYTTADAIESLKYLSPLERDNIVNVGEGIKVRLRNAGHILGSSIVELWMEDADGEIKVVFSGDLGKTTNLLLKIPRKS